MEELLIWPLSYQEHLQVLEPLIRWAELPQGSAWCCSRTPSFCFI